MLSSVSGTGTVQPIVPRNEDVEIAGLLPTSAVVPAREDHERTVARELRIAFAELRSRKRESKRLAGVAVRVERELVEVKVVTTSTTGPRTKITRRALSMVGYDSSRSKELMPATGRGVPQEPPRRSTI